MNTSAKTPCLNRPDITYFALHLVSSQPGLPFNVSPARLRSILAAAKQSGWTLAPTGEGRKLVLTIDDGRCFDPELPAVLDELGATAIFLVCTDPVIPPRFSASPHYASLSESNRQYLLQRHIIGSHTSSHTDLSLLSEAEQQRVLESSFVQFEKMFGFWPWCFSYPWGRYNKATLRILARLNIKFAFLAAAGALPFRHPFLVPRTFLDLPDTQEMGFPELVRLSHHPLANLKLAFRHLQAVVA